MKILALVFLLIFFHQESHAQNIVGFPREDFGKTVLSDRQFGGALLGQELEVSIENYNNEPISNYGVNSLFAVLGRPVGRLDILTDAGVFPCTAFLVSEKYLLTNYHCLPGIVEDGRVKAKRIEAVQLVLGYLETGVGEFAKKFTVSSIPAEADKELDYALVEVFGNPASQFGTVKLASSKPSSSYPFWIIGHPLGDAQRISREKCKSADPALSGIQLRHTCDTLPGNSGSPVFDPGSQAVVALHHAGSRMNSINFAIPLSEIVKKSEIMSGLIGGEPSGGRPITNTAFPAETVRAAQSYDGIWKLVRPKSNCRPVSFHFEVRGGKMQSQDDEGTVTEDGKLEIKDRASGGRIFNYAGKIEDEKGSGKYRGPSSRSGRICAGGFSVSKYERTNAAKPFDGLWKIERQRGNCRAQTFFIEIDNGKLTSHGHSGVVTENGILDFNINFQGDRRTYTYSGKIDAEQGSGTYRGPSGSSNKLCRGEFSISKI
jgi:hypothetical protein